MWGMHIRDNLWQMLICHNISLQTGIVIAFYEPSQNTVAIPNSYIKDDIFLIILLLIHSSRRLNICAQENTYLTCAITAFMTLCVLGPGISTVASDLTCTTSAVVTLCVIGRLNCCNRSLFRNRLPLWPFVL